MADLSDIINELITERDRLNAAIAALESVSNRVSRKASTKRRVSAAARAKIAAAQRKRWAKFRRAKKK